MDKEAIHKALSGAGLPAFPLDRDGYPVPGKVVKYYRERMVYIDKDGKQKHWTQEDLARRLNVTGLMVRLMETQNKGLDSIERRRILAGILNIPPALLGLASLTNMIEAIGGQEAKKGIDDKRSTVSKDTIKLYQDAFAIYSDAHSTSTAQESIPDIERWITRISDTMIYAGKYDRIEIGKVLWNFHALTAKIYGDDLFDWNRSFDHLNISLELARELDSSDLQAASLYRSAQVRFAQRNYALAKNDLDGTLLYAKTASPSVKGASFASASIAYSIVEKDQAGITYAQRLLDQAEKYIDAQNGNSIISFNSSKYLMDKADTLISLGRASKALEVLDDAEDLTDKSQKRRLAYLNILRAECYINFKKPEYDIAAMLLGEAFKASKDVRSSFNISHIARLYKLLAASSYGNAPEVVDMGMALRELRTK